MRRRDRPLTHDWIWSAIDTLAERRGLTPSALARLAGLDPTTFNRSKRLTPEGRPRWPSTESIAKVLEATGTTLDDFATLEFEDTLEISFDEAEEGEVSGVPIVGRIRDGVVPGWEPPLERKMAANGRQTAEPVHRHFALAVVDASLEPAYSAGSVLVASEAVAPRAGDPILVKPAGMPVLARLLIASTPNRIEIATFGSENKRIALRRRDIDWLARIVLVRQ